MIMRQVGLVSEAKTPIPPGELMSVAAALQKQVTQDLAPIWDVQATVNAFEKLEDLPVGYWALIITDDVPNAAGIHLDKNGQPYALAEYGPHWSLTASHECLEMLVDPTGNKVKAGLSPKNDEDTVEFLIEVSDPSEDIAFAYKTNDILVSDFYTPDFFADKASPSARYSFTGAIKEPRRVLKGGYLSWHELADDHWWQQRWFGDAPTFQDLGPYKATANMRSVRSWIYSQTTERLEHFANSSKLLTAAAEKAGPPKPRHTGRATRLRAELDAWRNQAK